MKTGVNLLILLHDCQIQNYMAKMSMILKSVSSFLISHWVCHTCHAKQMAKGYIFITLDYHLGEVIKKELGMILQEINSFFKVLNKKL